MTRREVFGGRAYELGPDGEPTVVHRDEISSTEPDLEGAEEFAGTRYGPGGNPVDLERDEEPEEPAPADLDELERRADALIARGVPETEAVAWAAWSDGQGENDASS
jgi:hypothetical protein